MNYLDILLRRRATVWLLLLFVFISACGEKQPPAEQLESALELIAAGNVTEATIVLKNLLREDPDFTEARFHLGMAQLEIGNAASAEKEFAAVKKSGVAAPEVDIGMIRAQLALGRFDLIVKEFEDGKVNPDVGTDAERATLHGLLGHAQYFLNEPDKAAEQYDAASALVVDHEEVLFGRARLSVQKGDLAAARERLKLLVGKHPEFAPGWSYLGDVEASEGNAKAAEAAYVNAIAQRSDTRRDLLRLALVRIYQGDLEQAEKDIESLLQKAANHPGALYAKGLLHLQRKDIDAAYDAFQQSHAKTPDYVPVTYYMGITNFLRGEYEQAQTHLTRVYNAAPDSGVVVKLLAGMRIQNHDYDGAEALLLPYLADHPDDTETLELLANAAAMKGNPSGSVEYLQRVLKGDDQGGYAHLNLGLGLLLAGEREEATKALKSAAKLSSGIGAAQQRLFQNYIANQEFDEAIALGEQLKVENPDSYIPRNYLGLAFMAKGEFEQAREHFDQALVLDPTAKSVINNLAMLAFNSGDPQTATATLEDALAKDPGHPGLTQQLVAMYTRSGEIDKARSLLESAVEANPSAVEPRMYLARYFLGQKEPDKVLKLVEGVSAAHPGDVRLLELVGRAQLMKGEHQAALKSFEKEVELVPYSFVAHYNRALALLSLGRTDAAKAALGSSLANNPNYAPAKISLARLDMLSGKEAAANKHLAQLKEMAPDHPEVIGLDGWLSYMQNDPASAIPKLQRVLSQVGNAQLVVDLASAQWQVKDLPGAIETHETWLAKHPKDVMVRTSLGAFQQALNRRSEAIETYRDVLEIDGDSIPALNNLAWLLREDDPNAAFEYASRAHELAPQSAEISDTLALMLLDRGDTAKALPLLEKAVKNAPSNGTIQYHYAQALLKDGNSAKAKSVLQAVVGSGRVFEESVAAKELLARLNRN